MERKIVSDLSILRRLIEEFSESENELLAEVRESIFSCTTRMKISNNIQIVKLLKTLLMLLTTSKRENALTCLNIMVGLVAS